MTTINNKTKHSNKYNNLPFKDIRLFSNFGAITYSGGRESKYLLQSSSEQTHVFARAPQGLGMGLLVCLKRLHRARMAQLVPHQ